MAFHPPEGPAKTAPKLYQDFLVFDPINTTTGNVLTHHPPPVGDGQPLAPHLSSCKHDYTTKNSQSRQPPLDVKPGATTQYCLAVVCKKCRIHAAIHLSYLGSMDVCPNEDWPLHTFQRLASKDIILDTRISFAWNCVAPQCQAELRIEYRQPRLDFEEVDLLTNPERLKKRYETVLMRDPAREGLRQATPVETLMRLRKYIHDSLSLTHTKRSFPANNKRFMESFGWMGEDCKALLERLGFSHAGDSWGLPATDAIDDPLRADGSSHRELLEDAEFELLALMYKQASENGVVNPAAGEGWSSANRDVERTFAAQGYPRYQYLRRPSVANDVLLYFASLGVLPDFADTLIIFAFDQQLTCDPARQPYYFECLQVIADARQTEDLQVKVATMESQDMVSRRDIDKAYRSLHVPEPVAQQSDSRILDCFQARLGDLGHQAADDARQALWKIGTSRASQQLIRASQQSVETYEDALAWLGNGLNEKSADDAIVAVLAIKNDESAANKEIGRQAVTVIAEARNSYYLKTYLSGDADASSMSVEEALRHLDITDSIDLLNLELLPSVFASARDDRPGENTEKAIKTIEHALSTRFMSNKPPPETCPVGLTSHGNTCYLNSLLQYYFSIKPFRDIVLEYDHHKLLGQELVKSQRVNGVFLTSMEIGSGQQYAEFLKALFERMIKDRGYSVKPENALIKRTFLDLADYHLLDQPTELTIVSDATPDNDTSEASSVTVQGINGDVEMTNTDAPLTPPASPARESPKPEPDHAPPLPPRPIPTESDKKNEKLALADERVRNQQDVNDVLDKVMNRLRAGIEPKGVDHVDGEQVDDLRDIFLIGMTESEDHEESPSPKTKKASDIHIQLQVPTEDTDIYSALDRYFDLQADVGDKDTYKSISKLPPVFQVAIPRSYRDEQGNNQKAEQLVRLEDEIYLDRYVDNSHADVLQRRRECWSLRRKLQQLKDEKKSLAITPIGLTGPTTLVETAKFLQQNVQQVNQSLLELGVETIEVDSQLPEVLLADSAHLVERDAAVEREMSGLQERLDGQFDAMKSLKYRLAAVFMHQGGGGGGHYWIYIHDFSGNVWRKYNDETVDIVTDLRDLYESKPGKRIPTPTYAVYVQDEMKDQFIQPVCRALEQEPEPELETADVHMTDSGNPSNAHIEGGQTAWDPPRQVAGAKW